jgi:putative salt-induced outer membrane protein YdiY
MPFSVDLGNGTHRKYAKMMPQDRPVMAMESASNSANITRVYQNYKVEQNVVIPLQRPNTAMAGAAAVGLQGQKRFGMRAMFM